MARISKAEKERIRSLIISVSERLFNEVGYDNTTTKQIASLVGVAEGTIFNYFSTKEEIMYEIIYQEAFKYDFKVSPKIVKGQIVDELFDRLEKMMKLAFRIPKGMGVSFIQAALKLAKKKPEKFKKMAEMDFKLIAEIEQNVKVLIEKGLMKEVDPKHFSEIIFGAVVFDFIMYFYSKEITKKETKNAIRSKLELLFNGYLKED